MGYKACRVQGGSVATRACGRVRGEGVACIAAGMNCVAAIAALLTEMSCRACANEVADVSGQAAGDLPTGASEACTSADV